MFKELENLIKPDQESLGKFENIKSKFLSDKKANDKNLVKRSRKVAIVLATSVVTSLLFLLYAFQVEEEANKSNTHLSAAVDALNLKLENCENN